MELFTAILIAHGTHGCSQEFVRGGGSTREDEGQERERGSLEGDSEPLPAAKGYVGAL